MQNIDKINELRKEIDLLDEQMAMLFQRRMEKVLDILKIKKKEKIRILDSARESFIIENAVKKFSDPILQQAFREFFGGILQISKNMQYEHISKENIVLIGFMGTGKTTIGHALSKILSARHMDIDTIIEDRQRMSISEIFKEYGEEYFRKIEHETIRSIADEVRGNDLRTNKNYVVISCGGGAVLKNDNVELLKNLGIVILLTSKPEIIYERLIDSSDRPLLKDRMGLDYIREFMNKRQEIYKNIPPDFILDTSYKSPQDSAMEIMNQLY